MSLSVLRIASVLGCLWAGFFLPSRIEAKDDAVTYTFSGGRFGDNLLSYYHAKWISYKYKIPLFFRPFEMTDKLLLQEIGLTDNQKINTQNLEQVYLGLGTTVNPDSERSQLYICTYFPENDFELQDLTCPGQPFRYFAVDWDDEGFRQELRRVVVSKATLPKLDLPKDRTTVAVHIRQGGGFDPSNMEDICPLKFCPLSYYITEVKRIATLLKNKPLHVHVFTDAVNPSELTSQLKQSLEGLDITYSCRTEGNFHNKNILEDFFALAQFDCLIRTHSNFSFTAGKIADYQIEISPYSYIKESGRPVIGQVDIKLKGQLAKRLPARTT